MTDPQLPHANHDPLLVAALTASDLTGRELADAQQLVTTCPDCAALATDLRALALATHELPAPARPRDFVLSAADAKRLRGTGWRRWLRSFAAPRFDLVRPLGAGLASLGIAGLLLAALPGVQLGDAASGPTFEIMSDKNAGSPGVDVGGRGSGQGAQEVQGQGAPADETPVTPDGDASALAERSTDQALIVVSGSFLIIGIGLFALRWTARRLGDG